MFSRTRPLGLRESRRQRLLVEDMEARTAPTANIFANVSTETALRTDIAAADSNSNSFADNVIELSGSITLTDTAAGQLEIDNSSSIAKTLTIEGQGSSPSDTVISGFDTPTSHWNSRIFEIVGTGAASITVVFRDLSITGGHADDGGVLGGTAALGGGILIDGGQVTLSNASVVGNNASGAAGEAGIGTDGNGGDGTSAEGGGIYIATGQLSVIDSYIAGNNANGGAGGKGGTGMSGLMAPTREPRMAAASMVATAATGATAEWVPVAASIRPAAA